MKPARAGADRFNPDELGMDELVLSGVALHMERMDDGSMWVGIDRKGKSMSLTLHCRGKLRVTVQDDDFGVTRARAREGGRVG